MTFNHGGAVDFGQLVLKTASSGAANQNFVPADRMYPPPPPSYSQQTNIPPAGTYDPNTGFFNFPSPSAPPPQNDAPPSYNSIQSGYGVTDQIQHKNQ